MGPAAFLTWICEVVRSFLRKKLIDSVIRLDDTLKRFSNDSARV